MNPRWLLMMKRMVQHPPSMGRVKMIAAILAFCLILFAIERIFGWPEWLTPNGGTGRRFRF